jgi:hypothetical protein
MNSEELTRRIQRGDVLLDRASLGLIALGVMVAGMALGAFLLAGRPMVAAILGSSAITSIGMGLIWHVPEKYNRIPGIVAILFEALGIGLVLYAAYANAF